MPPPGEDDIVEAHADATNTRPVAATRRAVRADRKNIVDLMSVMRLK